MKYQGYCENLPELRGRTVRIPKGTVIDSIRVGRYKARKSYNVTVRSVLPGISVRIGRLDRDGNPVYSGHTETDLLGYCSKAGIEPTDGSQTAVNQAIEQLYARAYTKPSNLNGNLTELWLDVENPSVSWAGSGGYWCDADINDVEIQDEPVAWQVNP